ncbi:hypothetical protein BC832DRAFT_266440 [Gaertneriomyces semiglobifer]|nr:hypothetical protein BC832DRAFT_266440 [Gaertneriomyces semiglobifer]
MAVTGQQHELKEYWLEEDQDLVVLPSLTFDHDELAKISNPHRYEERLLHHVLHLTHPDTRIVYVSSMPVDLEIVAYWLSLVPSAPSLNDLSQRLMLFSVHDASPHCLAQKLLRRPVLLDRIKRVIRPDRARLQVYRRTMFEKQVAQELGLPFAGGTPEEMRWGTKSGSRQAFRDADVPHPPGTYSPCRSVDRLVCDILRIMRENRDATKGMLKLDESFSGMGNGIVDLADVKRLLVSGEEEDRIRDAILDALKSTKFESSDESWDHFAKGVEIIGAVFELFIPEAEGQTTPSAQGFISETGAITILSTHEQAMDGKHYDGCVYPAREAYKNTLARYTEKLASVLRKNGIIGHFGVDFLVNSSDGGKAYDTYALEINLRVTATVFPFITLHLLTNGAPTTKHYLTRDHFGDEKWKVFTPGDVTDILRSSPYTWCHRTQKGCFLYMIASVAETGHFGITCVGDNPEECRSLMCNVTSLLSREAEQWCKVGKVDSVPDDNFDVIVGAVVEANGQVAE